jgi:integrase
MEELILDQDFLDKMGDYLTMKKYSYNTWLTYMLTLKKMAKKYGKLNQKIAFQWLKQYSDPPKIAIINLINNYCIDNDINFYIKVVRMRRKERKIPNIITFEEVKLLVDSIPNPYKLMFKCLFNIGAGLRISELVRMRYGKFNWATWLEDKTQNGLLILEKSKRGKSRAQNVPATLMSELYDYAYENNLIDEWRLPQDVLVFDFGLHKYKPELYKIDREKWTVEYIHHAADHLRYKILQKYPEKIIGKKITLHTLRHSRATYLYNYENLSIEEISKLIGHEKIITTMIYVHISPKKLMDSVKNVKSV